MFLAIFKSSDVSLTSLGSLCRETLVSTVGMMFYTILAYIGGN
jgi:hypothetical protein